MKRGGPRNRPYLLRAPRLDLCRKLEEIEVVWAVPLITNIISIGTVARRPGGI